MSSPDIDRFIGHRVDFSENGKGGSIDLEKRVKTANVLPERRLVGRPRNDHAELDNDKTNEPADGQTNGQADQPKGNDVQRTPAVEPCKMRPHSTRPYSIIYASTPAVPGRKIQTFSHVAILKRKRENCAEYPTEHRNKIIRASAAFIAQDMTGQAIANEAEELKAEVMETSKRVRGKEHPATLTSMANLASTYRKQGRWKKAEELGLEVMEASKRVRGKEHPATLTSMANLASTYWNQGRLEEAEKLEVEVMETSTRVRGKEHPTTLTSMANLASTYSEQEHWDRAEKLEVEVMEIRKRVLGKEHPATLTSMANLASTYWNQGRLDRAKKMEVAVMKSRKRVLGKEHPDTLTSMHNLAGKCKAGKKRPSTFWNNVYLRSKISDVAHPHTISSSRRSLSGRDRISRL